ncbi:MAG: hypothetical protein K8H87_13930, partial [Pseudorhodoplanes sp.]|nr:hypothetical protein [Pseudorhodoplanes sp.]
MSAIVALAATSASIAVTRGASVPASGSAGISKMAIDSQNADRRRNIGLPFSYLGLGRLLRSLWWTIPRSIECPVQELVQTLSMGHFARHSAFLKPNLPQLACRWPGKRVVMDPTRTKPIVPPRASQGRKAAYLAEQNEIGTDGLVARLTDRVFENPAMSGGLLVMALTATAIISNAMFLQSTRHPQPLFMTRPVPALLTPYVDPSAVPLPRRRADRTGGVSAPSADPPLP